MDIKLFLMGKFWQLCEKTEAERQAFSTLIDTWKRDGEEINDNLMSRLTRCAVDGKSYYIKAYKKRGKGLRRFLGRSRVRAEWENLKLLDDLGIPTLRIVAYGEDNRLLGAHRGAMVTEEIPNVRDLAEMAEQNDLFDNGNDWIDEVMGKLAMMVQLMHQEKFVHNDLKWRNILATSGDKAEVYIIDCPTGRSLVGSLLTPFFERGVIKDLACLDKVGRQVLSRARRLKFYMRYAGLDKLDSEHKVRIRKILAFFKGRE